VGRAKLYYFSQRIPLSAVLDISSNYIIILNSKLQLVQVNDPFRWFLQKAQRTALIEPNHNLPVDFFLNELSIKNNIVAALNGQESSDEITFQFIDGQEIFHVKFFPTIFEDGEKGVTICMENITQHKQAEEQLRQSEHRYRSLYELSPIGIGLATLDGKILASNKAARKITGFTEDELQGYDLNNMYVDKNERQYLLDQLTHGKSISDYLIKLKRKNGTTYTACVNVTQIILDNQPVIQTTIQDVTEQINMEEQLRSSEQRYRELFEGINDAVEVYDKHGNFLDCNEVTLQRLGYTRSEFLNLSVFEVVHPDYHERVKENLKREWAGETIVVESIHLTQNGESIPIEVNARKIEYYNGQALLAVVRDITKRKDAEQSLRESEHKFRTLAEQSPNMIFINQGGKIVYANKQCEDLMGYTLEEFQDDTFDFLSLIAPEYKAIVALNFNQHLNGQEVEIIKYELVTKHGERIHAILSTKLIEYDGKAAILGIVTDISERKRLEDTLSLYMR
jgi:PAS domain S-box-containing protein